MGLSPAHRFGQIIGDVLEAAIRPPLEAAAGEHGLYFDAKRPRAARGGKRKVAWVDGKGNTHDLDYVIEAGGTEEIIGSPKAFIEIAWRRYTRHSRNKAQEIQGAILPLAERYADSHPFLGIVLAGEFTDGSLNQLRSHGFTVMHFPYESILAAFASAGIDASSDDETPDKVFKQKVSQYERLHAVKKALIASSLRRRHKADLTKFIGELRAALNRRIASVYVLPLHGETRTLASVAEAISFIESFEESKPCVSFVRYEVGVHYSNGDEIRGQFRDKQAATTFLRGMR